MLQDLRHSYEHTFSWARSFLPDHGSPSHKAGLPKLQKIAGLQGRNCQTRVWHCTQRNDVVDMVFSTCCAFLRLSVSDWMDQIEPLQAFKNELPLARFGFVRWILMKAQWLLHFRVYSAGLQLVHWTQITSAMFASRLASPWTAIWSRQSH